MQYPFKATSLIILMVVLVAPLSAWGQTETIDELYKKALKEDGVLNCYCSLAQINAALCAADRCLSARRVGELACRGRQLHPEITRVYALNAKGIRKQGGRVGRPPRFAHFVSTCSRYMSRFPSLCRKSWTTRSPSVILRVLNRYVAESR